MIPTLVIDRRIRGVGRLKLASGTTHKPTFRRLNEMLDGLVSRGRIDIVRALKQHQLTPLQVYAAYRVNELDTLPTADMLVPLREAFETFVTDAGKTHHAANMKSAAKHIVGAAGKDATVGALVDAVRTLRAEMKPTPRMFNVVKATAQAFARERYGRASKVWLELAGIPQLKVRQRVVKHPATPRELMEITKAMPLNHALMAWSMALTGMRPKEYWGSWEEIENPDYIHIHGTKTKGAERRVPLMQMWAAPLEPQCWYGKFREVLAEASKGQMTPYDLRRSYANWLEDAGIPRTRRRLYMGHGAKDTTDLYEWRELSAYLTADAATLNNWLKQQLSAKSPENSHGLQVAR